MWAGRSAFRLRWRYNRKSCCLGPSSSSACAKPRLCALHIVCHQRHGNFTFTFTCLIIACTICVVADGGATPAACVHSQRRAGHG